MSQLVSMFKPQFLSVPAGRFIAGAASCDDAPSPKEFALSAFELMPHKVTVGQFKSYMEWGRGRPLGCLYADMDTGRLTRFVSARTIEEVFAKRPEMNDGEFEFTLCQLVPTMDQMRERYGMIGMGSALEDDDLPVFNVNWYEAAACAVALGGFLPNEVQWEYVARAGREGDYIFGSASGEYKPEERLLPNPWGFHGMAHTVWEWLSNHPTDDFSNWSEQDPADPLWGDQGYRAIRGGSMTGDFDGTFGANMGLYQDPSVVLTEGVLAIGFRVARDVQ